MNMIKYFINIISVIKSDKIDDIENESFNDREKRLELFSKFRFIIIIIKILTDIVNFYLVLDIIFSLNISGIIILID